MIDLQKLTVPQLKAICKEKRIVGYSKLNKEAMIQKLLASGVDIGQDCLAKVTNLRLKEKKPKQKAVANLSNPSPRLSDASGSIERSQDSQTVAHRLPQGDEPLKQLKRPASSSNAAPPTKKIRGTAAKSSAPAVKTLNSSAMEATGPQITDSEGPAPETLKPSIGSIPISQPSTMPGTKEAVIRHSTVQPIPPLKPPPSAAPNAIPKSDISTLKTATYIRPRKLEVPAIANSRPTPVISKHRTPATEKNTAFADTLSYTLRAQADESLPPTHFSTQRSPVPIKSHASPKKENLVQQALNRRAHALSESAVTTPLVPTKDQSLESPKASHKYQTTPQMMDSASKRFKPLVVAKHPAALSPPVDNAAFSSPHSIQSQKCQISPDLRSELSLRYLELISQDPPKLANIAFPPRIVERKKIPRLSLVLSQVCEEDILSIIMVSRSWRYSVYLSAIHRLRREFPGKRTEDVLANYKQSTTDYWPYLRFRRHERRTRQTAYDRSFLPRLFPRGPPIAASLWDSPSHVDQITVILRFLLSSVFFALSVSSCGPEGFPGKIVDGQEIVSGEIWQITIQHPTLENVYILASTGEVLGRPERDSPAHQLPLRVDWSTLIATHVEETRSTKDSEESQDNFIKKFDRLKWTNHEEYEKGLSRLWLKRIEKEGEVGSYKKVLAERYVLACVVANSISGRWMSSAEMEQDFCGIGHVLGPPLRNIQRVKPVTLFLPSHHLVESLHLTAPDRRHLHPALAVVQTPSREYYILKDNGMQVGCEEDGVGEVWMKILGCDVRGLPA